MARTPYATEIHDTSQKSIRIPSQGQPSFIVLHHAATESFRAVVTMELGTKQVSSTVVVKDGQVASMFDEFYRAWSLSSQYWDSVSLSSETCNSGGAAQGWPISEQSYVTLAKIVADWCRRYRIPCNRERIMGHREVYSRYGASYATACPGGIDLDRVVRDANKLLSGTAGNDNTPLEPELIIPEGYKDMSEPIYARGHKLDVVYALYLNAEQSNPTLNGSGSVYSGRRKVEAGERAIVEKLGFPHPKQTELLIIDQDVFDSINKLAYSA